MNKLKKVIALPLLVSFALGIFAPSAQAVQVYVTEEDGVEAPAFFLNIDDTSDDFTDLNFGTSSGAQLRYNVVDDDFTLNKNLDLAANELQNFKLERLAVAPTCDVSNEGRIYFNTTLSETFVCDGSVFAVLENQTIDTANIADGAVTSAKILDATITADDLAPDSVKDSELDYTVVTLADFTNDAGFVTTDNDTTYTGSGGITLTGTDFTNDLGTNIDVSELVSGGVGDANKLLTTDGTGAPQWEVKTNFATSAQGTLADSALQSGDNLSVLTNDAGYLTTVDISANTNLAAGTGATLTGDSISVDLGTSIDSSEIDTNAVNDDEINYTNVTLADFTNDAGFVTTDNDTLNGLSCASNEVAKWNGSAWACAADVDTDTDAQDLTLTGNTLALTNDGTTVDLSGYLDNTDTTYTGSGGITLTGTDFTNDLGTDIDVSEIVSAGVGDANKLLTTDGTGAPQWEVKTNFATSAQGALADSALQSGDNLSVLTNNAGYLTTVDISADTNLAAGTGATLTGDSISVDLGTSIDSSEIDLNTIVADDIAANAVQDSEIDYTAVTLADFTNDAGFVTTDNDTLNALACASNEVAKWNGSAWACAADVDTDTDTTYTGSGGITLTGTDFTNDLGTSIDSAEIDLNTIVADDIAANAVQDSEIDYTAVTLADFTNDAGFVTTDNDTTYTGSGGITLTGTNFTNDLGTTIETGEITNGTITFADLNNTDITLADFTNDAGFVTTDNDTTYTGGTGITLTGTVFSNDLGTNIDVSEIVSAGVGDANKLLTTDGTGAPQWEVKSNFATSAQGTLADSALQSGDNLSVLTNDAGYLTTVDISANTNLAAGTGATLTGDSISVDLGTSIDSAEIDLNTIVADDIAANAVQDSEIDYTAVTLADFTNDAGFVTTDNDTLNGLSCASNEVAKWNGSAWACAADVDTDTDTTYTGSGGITLTGTDFTNDLGTSIDSAEIDLNTIVADDIAANAVKDSELDYTAVTLADFTNDAGFVTTDNDTTYTGGTGITLTGTVFSNDLGTDIDVSEIISAGVGDSNKLLTTDGTGAPQWEVKSNFATSAQGTLADSALQSGDNVSVLTNDAGYLTTVDISADTNLAAGTGATLTGDSISVDLGTSIDATEIDTNAVNDDEINYTNVTLADFTNDAGFVTTDNDTTYTGSGGITLTGTDFTNDLGTNIDVSEIISAGVGDANKLLTTDGTGAPQWEVKTNFATSAQGALADSALQSGDNLSVLTNDAGYLTTIDISADTNLVGGTGATLVGDTLNVDLGTTIETGEITNGTITFADLNNTDITLADFTNDLALTSANIFVGSAGGVATGVAMSNDATIDNAGALTIANNAVDGTDIALGSDTAGDIMYYNGTDWARLVAGTAGTYLATGATPSWDNVDTLQDADGNTKIQVEEGVNDDTIRLDTTGVERMVVDATGNVLIGAAAETIANAGFIMNGNDVFMADSLGVEGPIYTDATAIKYQFVDIYGCVRGSAAAGTVAGGQSPVIRFDSGGNSQIRCSIPVPDDWVSGTDINIETYWSPSDNTTGDIDFDLNYASFAVGETIGSGSFVDTIPGTTYETVTVNTQLDIYEMIGDIPAAAIALDDMINFRLRRTPGDAGDTYTGDTNIHMVRMAYTGKRLE